ncbi:24195_t:CDS:2 [Entrophospora sp. SA101]|nr:24195_t:CDS:2 [Entrophospora sp. SA101]
MYIRKSCQVSDKYELYENKKEININESDILYEEPGENEKKNLKLQNDSSELFPIVEILNNPSTLSSWMRKWANNLKMKIIQYLPSEQLFSHGISTIQNHV